MADNDSIVDYKIPGNSSRRYQLEVRDGQYVLVGKLLYQSSDNGDKGDESPPFKDTQLLRLKGNSVGVIVNIPRDLKDNPPQFIIATDNKKLAISGPHKELPDDPAKRAAYLEAATAVAKKDAPVSSPAVGKKPIHHAATRPPASTPEQQLMNQATLLAENREQLYVARNIHELATRLAYQLNSVNPNNPASLAPGPIALNRDPAPAVKKSGRKHVGEYAVLLADFQNKAGDLLEKTIMVSQGQSNRMLIPAANSLGDSIAALEDKLKREVALQDKLKREAPQNYSKDARDYASAELRGLGMYASRLQGAFHVTIAGQGESSTPPRNITYGDQGRVKIDNERQLEKGKPSAAEQRDNPVAYHFADTAYALGVLRNLPANNHGRKDFFDKLRTKGESEEKFAVRIENTQHIAERIGTALRGKDKSVSPVDLKNYEDNLVAAKEWLSAAKSNPSLNIKAVEHISNVVEQKLTEFYPVKTKLGFGELVADKGKGMSAAGKPAAGTTAGTGGIETGIGREKPADNTTEFQEKPAIDENKTARNVADKLNELLKKPFFTVQRHPRIQKSLQDAAQAAQELASGKLEKSQANDKILDFRNHMKAAKNRLGSAPTGDAKDVSDAIMNLQKQFNDAMPEAAFNMPGSALIDPAIITAVDQFKTQFKGGTTPVTVSLLQNNEEGRSGVYTGILKAASGKSAA